jgi:hypothetical protein
MFFRQIFTMSIIVFIYILGYLLYNDIYKIMEVLDGKEKKEK